MIYPGVQIKAVEGNTLCANPDFNETRSDLGVEAIPVHSQIEGRVPQPDQPWCDGVMASRDFTHVCPKCRARTRVENIRWQILVVSQGHLALVSPTGVVRTALLS